jgi:hypothetical protein
MSLVAGPQVISMFVAGSMAEKIGIPNLRAVRCFLPGGRRGKTAYPRACIVRCD